MRWRVSLRAAGLVVVLGTVAQLNAGVMYTVTDLGTLGGSTSAPYGINDLGQVVGESSLPGNSTSHAFRTAPNQPINPLSDDLGSLGPGWSMGYGINNVGQVVGDCWISAGVVHAFRTGPNKGIDATRDNLGTLGGSSSYARAISDAGQVVGKSKTLAGTWHAFRAAPDRPMDPIADDLGTFGGPWSEAYGINNAGQAVGEAWTVASRPCGFRTRPNHGIDPATDDIGGLADWASWASAINASGQVAGTSRPSLGSGDVHALHIFRTAPNEPINPVTDDLDTVGDWIPEVRDINDRGDIVGNLFRVEGDMVFISTFLYLGSSAFELGDIIDPASDWQIKEVFAMNNRGQIVGVGHHDGIRRGFRLDPVPEPSGCVLAVAGLLVCAGRRVRAGK